MRARGRPPLRAALACGLCVGASLLAPPTATAQDQADAPALVAWYDCSTDAAARLDDGRSDAATVAEALATSCQPQWDASKAEQCAASELSPQACALLSDKLDANRRSYEIKVVLAHRARKAEASPP